MMRCYCACVELCVCKFCSACESGDAAEEEGQAGSQRGGSRDTFDIDRQWRETPWHRYKLQRNKTEPRFKKHTVTTVTMFTSRRHHPPRLSAASALRQSQSPPRLACS